jgi:transposase
MPFQRRRALVVLDETMKGKLQALTSSRTEPAGRVQRAQMLLAYAEGESISAIARRLQTNRPKVERCVDKALQLGAWAALDDLPRRGRPRTVTPEARAWVLSLACQKPKALGYSYELWTTRLLAQHVRQHCEQEGHPCLRRLARGTVSKWLTQGEVRPHKIVYYVERRDPDFPAKMAQVLHVYKEVQLLKQQGGETPHLVAFLAYDEKPGIQAVANVSEDLPPVPGEHPCICRDYEYVRLGTMSLLAGIDLMTGHVHGVLKDRHRSAEFIEFLRLADRVYPKEMTIRMVLDTVPNRFEFIFTPTHGSWLNLIESFFAKMAKTMLRGLRVESKAELKARIEQYLHEINQTPVVHRWKYGLDSLSVA